ncbi:methyltransferase domain-containing protein [Enterococcus caccae]|uniref:Methyltransferase domain-containing protein n=1 Tax=Enterococcus caccae ATCC BAA-1240 TaxID=1158612 RepID=R3W7A0_9ENTE|nr:methyltransferase domain-containing protein [Enterococcus caccae]EOL43656.1 hypothetical protein UC7_02986 [Enterococcus caccae ATCC BAA-1240]EOT67944.1 hypothetical protein I580_00326 [Enterococcus caccae ATCC BAA-1240]OJG28568.1 hypothetical protein RU98_GL000161 [Enterococcus caccae]
MEKEIKENQLAWEQASKYHQEALGDFYDLAFQKEEFMELSFSEEAYFSNKSLGNLKIAHLCCNNGKEVFSLAKLNALEAVGFDFNQIVIDEAKNRTKLLKLNNVKFIQSEIGDIDSKYNKNFDIVLVNVGTLGWFPSLDYFFSTVSRMLKPNGEVFINDIHPFCEILNDDRNESLSPLEVTGSYFSKQPFFNEKGIDYIGKKQYKSLKSNWYNFTISELLNSLVKNNLDLISFEEYSEDIGGIYPILKEQAVKVPLSFSIVAKRNNL